LLTRRPDDTSKWTDFKVIDFDLKPEEDDDVTIAIECCGVCGSGA
jgi:alcohol dehydrogenase (NADP+)